ncbi:MAG TPA: hypothetical protein VI757_02780 [Bacteroidia bacterium]|nr:hypothetical protein [Bacteroidia bacterium]
MKNIAIRGKGEKTNLSFAENEKGNRNNNKRNEKMKQHFIAIMQRIVAERQWESVRIMY